MNKIELSLGQAGKVLWSFLWRAWILMMPPAFIMVIAMRMLMPIPKPGEPGQPMDPKQIPSFVLIWLVVMSLTVISQIFALRWALKAKWSNFRILSVSEP